MEVSSARNQSNIITILSSSPHIFLLITFLITEEPKNPILLYRIEKIFDIKMPGKR